MPKNIKLVPQNKVGDWGDETDIRNSDNNVITGNGSD